MPEFIGLDFETYGAEDLPTHGLARYTGHKTFQPLIASWAKHTSNGWVTDSVDFTFNRKHSVATLAMVLEDKAICAHNAPFEREVLATLGLDYPAEKFIDSAVVARAAGAGSSLEAAAPQLLGLNKMELGKSLIKLFSIPGKYQKDDDGNFHSGGVFDDQVIKDHPDEWRDFRIYCELDAKLSLQIVEGYLDMLTPQEVGFQAITMDMNRTGWCVDVPLVEEMQRRYLENQEQALYEFRRGNQADDLNLNSLPQMKAWCAERGVKATSFDEKNVERLRKAIEKKLSSGTLDEDKLLAYGQVADLLDTKQILGGSSLKKLQVILDTAQDQGDGTHRLKDQYMHVGAGQSWRTTGRSVQMQNLKRLQKIADMDELADPGVEWDNTKLAENLRQVFTASHPGGRLIVGDFSSVESRGLAWLAGEGWKLKAFREGLDVYKVGASRQFDVGYDEVTKDQRQFGKVGELSCGYQAGGGAVQAFAANMGVELNEAEAAKLVYDWRLSNPMIVAFWDTLDEMLHEVVEHSGSRQTYMLPDGMRLFVERALTPSSLLAQHPAAQSIRVEVQEPSSRRFLVRYFHGCYVRGRNISYYKPSDRKTGDLWSGHYIDPKTKQVRFYEIYGGKLAGILTQSFCRELFFRCLRSVHTWVQAYDNVQLVGQFHDEIVLDWWPVAGVPGLAVTKAALNTMMSEPGVAASFPLAADIKDDYRYTK